jgi:hypothetical protein
MPRNANEWRQECAYISDTADRLLALAAAGRVNDEWTTDTEWPQLDLFTAYCATMKALATRQRFHDSATYIGEILDDLT